MKKLMFILVTIFSIGCSNPKASDSYIRDRVVKLMSAKGGSCSGIQVKAPSKRTYILTAAHCLVLADKDGMIIAENEYGDTKEVKVIEEDPASDLLLLESMDNDSIEIAKFTHKHEKVHTITHGGGHMAHRTDGELMEDQRVTIPMSLITKPEELDKCLSQSKMKPFPVFIVLTCAMDTIDTMSTAKVAPGSSGGAVLNEEGQLVGIVSAGNANYSAFVRLSDIQNFMKDK